MCLQYLEKRPGKTFSTLCFCNTDRPIEIAIRRRWETAQHGLNNHHMRFRRKRSPQDVTNDLGIAAPHHKRLLTYRVSVPISCLTNREATASLGQVSLLKDENAGNIFGSPERNIVIGNHFDVQC